VAHYTRQELNAFSRVVSHALRHEPWLYELELDDAGWVSVDELLAAVRAKPAEGFK
jgi:putative RNA 2'-phosphotransferase